MPDPAPKSLHVAVTGASGFVGTPLVARLLERGHRVTALSRSGASRASDGRVRWASYDPMEPASYAKALEGVDAVIHLAGHGVFDGRWNDERMALIRSSRVEATRALVGGLKLLAKRPATLVSASAVGYYGPRHPAEDLPEAAAPGNDFLAEVCVGWESEARMAEALGVRVALPRIGIVLGRGGGALASMLPPFKMGVGGPIGLTGGQPFPWIHLADLVALIVEMAENPAYKGAVNAVSPGIVSNKAFAQALGRALHRPAFMPTPGFAIRLLVGKAAQILTSGQRALPRAALANGFAFAYPDVDGALADLVGEPVAEPGVA